jgi:hypothetical protein
MTDLAENDLQRRRRTLDVMEAAADAEQRAERPDAALARTEAVLKLDGDTFAGEWKAGCFTRGDGRVVAMWNGSPNLIPISQPS